MENKIRTFWEELFMLVLNVENLEVGEHGEGEFLIFIIFKSVLHRQYIKWKTNTYRNVLNYVKQYIEKYLLVFEIFLRKDFAKSARNIFKYKNQGNNK